MDIFSKLYGSFSEIPLTGPEWVPLTITTAASIIVLVTLMYLGVRLFLINLAVISILFGSGAPATVLYIMIAFTLLSQLRFIRKYSISLLAMRLMKRRIPRISTTEREALDAGTLWIEKDIFSGRPNLKKILNEPYPVLSAKEQEFIDGPVEQLCAVLNEWEPWKTRRLPKSFWEIIGKERLFGMIIPTAYGGLGLSATAHSHAIMKLASKSLAGAITVMVPNSLGPSELLIQYGTEEQKAHFLPRLANAQEIPCFALTEANAGTDAASIQATGVLFKDETETLSIKLNWDKRYITLAPVATLLGIAFRLQDPDNILEKGTDLGITLALIPTSLPGVSIGRHHDPLGIAFPNGPTQGQNVVIPISSIIGGENGIGRGWKMLMESLAAGRGISLPALSVGGAKIATRTVSAYIVARRQFGLPIGQFEGIEEPMARIVGLTYLMEAARIFNCGAIDSGVKPPITNAIAKYHQTELMRKIINDGMDITGGAGISRGAQNILSELYIGAPINITVEGANIMTRSLIIFGQGSLRAHPFAYDEIQALESNDRTKFDRVFWGHAAHFTRNLIRALLLNSTPDLSVLWRRERGLRGTYRRIARASSVFAVLTDLAIMLLGGQLKRKEALNGHFSDLLSWIYLSFAVIRRYHADGQIKEDAPFANYAIDYSCYEIQKAIEGILINLRMPGFTWVLKGLVLSWFRLNPIGKQIPHALSSNIAQLIQSSSLQRDRFTNGIYLANDKGANPAYNLDQALLAIETASAAEEKILSAVRANLLPRNRSDQLIDQALTQGIITEIESEQLKASMKLRSDVIRVNDFSAKEYLG